MIRIPPKFSVSAVMGYIKGKSAIRMARDFMGRHQSFKGYHFWARGYFVSTVGIDEEIIRKYIREQEKNDKKLDQKKLFYHCKQPTQLNYRFERFTMEASGFAGGDSLPRN